MNIFLTIISLTNDKKKTQVGIVMLSVAIVWLEDPQ